MTKNWMKWALCGSFVAIWTIGGATAALAVAGVPQTPEPGSFAMLGASALAAGSFLWARSRKR